MAKLIKTFPKLFKIRHSSTTVSIKLPDLLEKKVSLSFAFSGSGWLTPFHLGVLHSLKKNGFIHDNTVIAGTSGGAITALVGCCNISETEVLDLMIDLSADDIFRADIDNGLRYMLGQFVPDNCVQLCNDRLRVVVTDVWPKPSLKPNIISRFQNKNEIIESVLASSFIPIWSAPKFTASLSNSQLAVDGGFLR
jgi:hypothetical protein